MKLILWVLQGLLRLVALCVILYYTLICSIMIVRRGPRWWMRRSWDEVYDVQDRLNELILGNLLEKRSKMKTRKVRSLWEVILRTILYMVIS